MMSMVNVCLLSCCRTGSEKSEGHRDSPRVNELFSSPGGVLGSPFGLAWIACCARPHEPGLNELLGFAQRAERLADGVRLSKQLGPGRQLRWALAVEVRDLGAQVIPAAS